MRTGLAVQPVISRVASLLEQSQQKRAGDFTVAGDDLPMGTLDHVLVIAPGPRSSPSSFGQELDEFAAGGWRNPAAHAGAATMPL